MSRTATPLDVIEGRAKWCVIVGDCLEVLPTLPPDCIDAVVTDPPYHLTQLSRGGSARTKGTGPYGRHTLGEAPLKGFMGTVWDGGDVAFREATWEAVMRVAKPGAHLLAAGGTRTYHRLACAIDDAGWEMRDAIPCWLHAQGFPKNASVSKHIDKQDSSNLTCATTDAAKEWEGWGTALKPAVEMFALARKPLSEGTVASNVLKHGTGAINIDGCRIHSGPSAGGDTSGKTALGQSSGWNAHNNRDTEIDRTMSQGRWPANVAFVHSENCVKSGTGGSTSSDNVFGQDSGWNKHNNVPTVISRPGNGDETETVDAYECVEGCPVAMLDAQSGTLTSGDRSGHRNMPKSKGIYGDFALKDELPSKGDSGGASRFFYTSKASGNERWVYSRCACGERAMLSSEAQKHTDGASLCRDCKSPRENIGHPTVKPLKLMQWLCRLICRKGGVVLDPFGGSGSTALAALAEGCRVILIEKDANYAEIARARIEAVIGRDDGPLFAGRGAKP